MSSFLSRLTAEPAPLAWLERQACYPWLIVGLVSTGAFLGQFDATVVQLALPSLAGYFDQPIHHVSWVTLAYLAAFVAFLPVFGRLCDMFGRKTLYIIGYLIFIGASALCGMVSEFWQLLAFRFLQGLGGALLGANSISILVHTVSPAQRGRALGWFAAAQAVGMSAGPVFGGVLIETLGWRWIFWLTVPFGAAAVIAGWITLPRSTGARPERVFDWGGAVLIGPALVLIVAALNHAAGRDFNLGYNLGMVAIAALLLALLVRRERRFRAPLINPALFHSAAFRSAAAAVLLGYAQISAMFFLMSFAEARGFGESPLMAGLNLAIVPLAIGLSAPFSHAVQERLGGHRVGMAAMLLSLSAVVLLFATLGRAGHHGLFDSLAFAVFGTGLGLFIAPNNGVAIAAVPPALSGAAGALLNLMRALGTSLGVAGSAALLTLNLRVPSGTSQMSPSFDGPNMLAAVRDCLPLLGVMVVLAGLCAGFAARRLAPKMGGPLR